MAGIYSQNDTHDFVKSCVSLSGIGMSIHKLADPRSVLRTGTVKNVYETQESGCPYIYSGASSAAQQAHSLYKTRLLFCPGSASAATAAVSHAAQSSCRAARPAGRTRELKGERTGMYFYRNQASLIYEWCNICIRSMDITPGSSYSRI